MASPINSSPFLVGNHASQLLFDEQANRACFLVYNLPMQRLDFSKDWIPGERAPQGAWIGSPALCALALHLLVLIGANIASNMHGLYLSVWIMIYAQSAILAFFEIAAMPRKGFAHIAQAFRCAWVCHWASDLRMISVVVMALGFIIKQFERVLRFISFGKICGTRSLGPWHRRDIALPSSLLDALWNRMDRKASQMRDQAIEKALSKPETLTSIGSWRFARRAFERQEPIKALNCWNASPFNPDWTHWIRTPSATAGFAKYSPRRLLGARLKFCDALHECSAYERSEDAEALSHAAMDIASSAERRLLSETVAASPIDLATTSPQSATPSRARRL